MKGKKIDFPAGLNTAGIKDDHPELLKIIMKFLTFFYI